VEAVKAALEVTTMTPLVALEQRTWLLHWSLFVYWNDRPKGALEQLVDLFHSEKYKQAITTLAPHLLRYFVAAVLLCKRRVTKQAAGSNNAEARRLMKHLIHVMADCEYSDPIVEFVNCLCVKFDFDSAQAKLAECEQVLDADFFLCEQTAMFMEEARVFVFENYCRIHNKIDLRALGEKLAMDQEQAERWIVDLIRNADLDAKIDSDEGCVVMGSRHQSVYEQVVDRTRDLNVRSATLVQNLKGVLNDARKEKAKKERGARED
jgi:translation initiation factor 3 subunit E